MGGDVSGAPVLFRSRGVGNNWLPCFICGHLPKYKCQADMAGFVDASLVKHAGDEHFHPIQDLFHQADLLVGKVDFRSYEPGRVQVKIGACGEHEPNLRLLDWMVQHAEDSMMTEAMLGLCIPGRKRP